MTADSSCRVTAVYQGKTGTRNITIKNVPAELTSIQITGPTSVYESTTTAYTCTAHYSDGSSANVTNDASWSENSWYASINGSGKLTTSSVRRNQSCRITARYGGETDRHNVTIRNR